MTLSAAALSAFNVACAAASAAALAGGDVDILDASGNVLASADLGTPSAAGAVSTMGGFPRSTVAIATGVAASGRYRTSAGGDWKTGLTVGTSGADITLSSLSFSVGQALTINSAILTHAAASAT